MAVRVHNRNAQDRVARQKEEEMRKQQEAYAQQNLLRDKLILQLKNEKIEDELRSLTRNVVLIGMPGAGKTSCGKRLARMLGRPFVDIDEAILADTGRGAAHLPVPRFSRRADGSPR